MNVGFICRKNQIRSPFAAAVVASIFPEIETFSAGTDIDLNSQFHPRAIQLATKWGISLNANPTTSLNEARQSLKHANLIVAAEDELVSKISVFPRNGILTSFSEIAVAPAFVPIDPIGLSDQEFKLQMSKISYIAIRSVCKLIYTETKKSIYAIVPISENIFDLALEMALFENSVRDGILIYVDFRAYLDQVPGEIKIIRFNPQNIDENLFFSGTKNCIFLPDREMSEPEKLFLNRKWIDLIFRISVDKDVILLTAPRYLETGKLNDSYLAVSAADTISVINA